MVNEPLLEYSAVKKLLVTPVMDIAPPWPSCTYRSESSVLPSGGRDCAACVQQELSRVEHGSDFRALPMEWLVVTAMGGRGVLRWYALLKCSLDAATGRSEGPAVSLDMQLYHLVTHLYIHAYYDISQ